MPECTGNKNVKNGIFVNVSVMYQFLKNGIVVIVRLDHIPSAIYCYFFINIVICTVNMLICI